MAGGLNLYGYAAGDPINRSDPFGLSACPPACPLPLLFSPAVPGATAVLAAAGPVAAPLAAGTLVGVMLAPAFPGDGEPIAGQGSGTFAAEATAVYSRREGAQIRAAIKSVTGENATKRQYDCMSQYIHECKESGDGGSKNEKGDFTWDELLQIARDLFGKRPQ